MSFVSDKETPRPASIKAVDGETGAIDPKAEARLVRKLDMRILPVLALAYLLVYLDRANAGNARVAGLATDLNLGPYTFNTATCLFYLAYILSDIPAALFIRKYGFKWIPRSVVGFGIVTICCAFLQNGAGFMAVRFFLGFAEAFVLPGNTYLLARYYTRKEITMRVAVFIYCAAYLSGAFGGLLASVFIQAPDIGMISTWRHIFLWEGLITIVLGVLLCFLYPADVTTTKMLTEEERTLALARLQQGQVDGSSSDRDENMSFREVGKIICHPQILVGIAIFICNNVTVQGLNSFLPTVIRLNYPGVSIVRVQLLSVPPNVVACFWALLCSYLAMRTRQHALFAMLGGLMSTTGYAIWVATDGTFIKTRYFAVFLNNSSGFYGPLVMSWCMANAKSDKVRSLTGAAIAGIGALGSIVSPWTYLPSTEPSGYLPGNALNMALSIFVVVAVGTMRLFQMRLNKKSGDEAFKYMF